jgi:hypothetical protein
MSRTVASGVCIKELEKQSIIVAVVVLIIINYKNNHIGTAYILQKVLMFEYRTYFMGEITLLIAHTVNTEQLQHYIPYKLGFFQVYNCKYPV